MYLEIPSYEGHYCDRDVKNIEDYKNKLLLQFCMNGITFMIGRLLAQACRAIDRNSSFGVGVPSNRTRSLVQW